MKEKTKDLMSVVDTDMKSILLCRSMKRFEKIGKVVVLSLCLLLINCASTSKNRSFGEVVDDNMISIRLRTKFTKNQTVPASQIQMKVRKGIVQLKGYLDNQNQIDQAILIAEQEKGVKEVKAYLVLKEYMPQKSRIKKPSFLSNVFKKSGQKNHSGKKNNVIEEDLLQNQGQNYNSVANQDESTGNENSDLPKTKWENNYEY